MDDILLLTNVVFCRVVIQPFVIFSHTVPQSISCRPSPQSELRIPRKKPVGVIFVPNVFFVGFGVGNTPLFASVLMCPVKRTQYQH